MKDNEIARLVNELTDIAEDYGATQQLRQRISQAVHKAVAKSDGASSKTIHDLNIGDPYYHLNSDGTHSAFHWDNIPNEKHWREQGSLFLTKEEAGAESKWRKANWKRLRAERDVCNRLRELEPKGWKPEFNGHRHSYVIQYAHLHERFDVALCCVTQVAPIHLLSTKEAWETVLKEMPDKVKLMMGIE